MTSNINMNRIKRFAEFNSTTGILKVDGAKLKDSDVGFYVIDVSATFSNGTHSKQLSDKFKLEIRADPASLPPRNGTQTNNTDVIEDIIEGEIDESKVIYASDWEGLIEMADDAEVFSKD